LPEELLDVRAVVNVDAVVSAFHGTQISYGSPRYEGMVGRVRLIVLVWHGEKAIEVMLLAYCGSKRVDLGPIRDRILLVVGNRRTTVEAETPIRSLSHAICFPAQADPFVIVDRERLHASPPLT